MSPLELIAVSLAFGALLCRFLYRDAAPWLLACASAALLIALVANPARWPLYPALAGLALAALVVLRRQGGEAVRCNWIERRR